MVLPNRKYNPYDHDDRAAPVAEAELIAMPDATTKQPLRIGEVLKRERERRGYDLQQIADYLCIRRGLLAAIENSRYEEFPADAYVIGFLRSYADLIGLNGQEAINHYRQEMAGRRKKPDLILPIPVSEGRAPTAVIMGAAALASLIIYILWYAFSTNDRTTVSTPPVLPAVTENGVSALTNPTAVETVATTPSGIAIAAPAPVQQDLSPPTAPGTNAAPVAAAAATSSGHIVIKADQSSWILVANAKGETVYDHVMKPGETYQVPNQQGLTLTTGNGAGIVVVVDGAEMPRLATSTSHIVRNVPLEAASLKALPQKPAE